MSGHWIVGLDIGGTFTDVVMVETGSGQIARHKVLSTPTDPAKGALQGIDGLLELNNVAPRDVEVVLHATTLVSNALIERKGAVTALLTTKGFRDTLDLAREKKYDIYDLQLEKPRPLVPRQLRFEVCERIAADGGVVKDLSSNSTDAAVQWLQEAGVGAVAICLLHSYMNPAHEVALRNALMERLNGIAVSISSEILPEIREYERTSTTAANAFVQPVTALYLQSFCNGLIERGVTAPLFVMLSEGGIASPELVRRFPVRICESGPAAGAVTAASLAKQRDLPRVLSFDMGGTTAKTALIHDGMPMVCTDFEVARMYRFKKGSGLPLKVPVVDLIEIGAGGGSIVRVDDLGLIKVGPDSIGADPGPACYGRGGTLATVTDADLVLGYLGEDSFLGGRMSLSRKLANEAIERHVAGPLGIDVISAARGIHDLVNENMANASRVQAVERGHDPSGYAMVAFGGAGPVHAWGVAKRLAVSRILVPPTAGLGSALGLLLAPRAYRISRTLIGTLDRLEWEAVERLFTDMATEASNALDDAGVARHQIEITRQADMRYLGQRKEVTVTLPPGRLSDQTASTLRQAFEKHYHGIYHRIHDGYPIEALSWRLLATGPEILQPHDLRPTRSVGGPLAAAGMRPMTFDGFATAQDCPVYQRSGIAMGTVAQGPCVVEEDECSIVVGPGGRVTIDEFANLIVDLPERGVENA